MLIKTAYTISSGRSCIIGKILFSVSLFFVLILSGCDLFSTRSAESPTQVNSNFQSALVWQDLITNLKNAIHDGNVENYLACFSDTLFTSKNFTFIPSSGAALQFPALTDSWNKKDEEQYFTNIKSYQMNLSLTNENYSQQGDSLIYTAAYVLDVFFDNSGSPQIYQGELRFDMIRDSRSVWVIYLWQDTKNTDNPSWSELKGRFH
jgi:hypothetical protein